MLCNHPCAEAALFGETLHMFLMLENLLLVLMDSLVREFCKSRQQEDQRFHRADSRIHLQLCQEVTVHGCAKIASTKSDSSKVP